MEETHTESLQKGIVPPGCSAVGAGTFSPSADNPWLLTLTVGSFVRAFPSSFCWAVLGDPSFQQLREGRLERAVQFPTLDSPPPKEANPAPSCIFAARNQIQTLL